MDLPNEIIETKPYDEMTDYQVRRFLNFIDWLKGVERIMFLQGVDATGIMPKTPRTEDYVFRVGQAEIAVFSPEYMDDQLQAAPTFPSVVPDDVSPPELRRRIDRCFSDETEMNPEVSIELAVDVHRQGRELLERAGQICVELSDRNRNRAATSPH